MRSSLFVLFAVLLGCSSNESSTTSSKPPSASPDKKLNEMSASEAQTYCSETTAFYASKLSADETKRAACNLAAAFATFDAKTDAEAQMKCKAAYDQCLADPGSGGDAGAPRDPCAGFADKAKTCNGLTVAEYNACQDEQVAFLKALADPTLCSQAKVSSSGGPGSTAGSPKCDVVKAKCPALATSGG